MKEIGKILLVLVLAAVVTSCGCGCCNDCAEVKEEGYSRVSREIDERDRWYLTSRSKETLQRIDDGERLTLRDVIHMHQAGMLSEDIIRLLEANNSTQDWDMRELVGLQALGVAPSVLKHLAEAQEVADASE